MDSVPAGSDIITRNLRTVTAHEQACAPPRAAYNDLMHGKPVTPSRSHLVWFLAAASLVGCGSGDRLSLRVELGTRGLSKLPFVIAYDQGLYEKHGLDVELFMPPPEFDDGIEARRGYLTRYGFRKAKPVDIVVDGATPMMVDTATNAKATRQIVLASTDCVVRSHIIGQKGVSTLEELKGKRIGISAHVRTTTSFVALLLAQRMGWDPTQDISLLRNGWKLDSLEAGKVDAIVANERTFAAAHEEGFPILADTRTWNEAIAGNSVRVEPEWLEQGQNREAARRFLKASIEGIAVFHNQPDIALDVLARWHGIVDEETAQAVYARGATIPAKPFPCYDGIRKTMELYDSNEMRRYVPEDFYDDSLLRELDESGFIAALYEPSSDDESISP